MAPKRNRKTDKATNTSNAKIESQKGSGESGNTEMVDQAAPGSEQVEAGSAAVATNEETTAAMTEEPNPSPPPASQAKDPMVTGTADTLGEDNVTSNKQEITVGPTAETTLSLSRSGRKRVAPVRFGDVETPIKTPIKTPAVKRPKVDHAWTEDFLLNDARSNFGQVDLTNFFIADRAYSGFTEAEKKDLCGLVPPNFLEPDVENPSEEGNEKVKYDMNFRYHLRCFANDLKGGRYDPEWIKQADEAMQARARGEFDAYKEGHFEEFWGQKQVPATSKGRKSGK